MTGITLRPYASADEEATIELWRRTWQQSYPQIDFTARTAWWRERWRGELVPRATIVVADDGGIIVGFMTVEPATGYLDQIVVAPEYWGTDLGAALLAEAQRISPAQIELRVNQDNARAISFYRKHGFVLAGDDVSLSGRPLYRMTWRP